MSDPTYDALLLSVLADPQDDAPRLILADYLGERGDERRAEFVRLQCVLARERHDPGGCRATGPCTACGRVAALRGRERESFPTAAGAYWDWLGGTDWPLSHFDAALPNWRRGFLAKVTCPLADWLTHGPAVVRRQPVELVVVADREPRRDGTGYCWVGVDEESIRVWPGERFWLPMQAWSLLQDAEFQEGRHGPKFYVGREDALHAISDALLLHARRRAFPCKSCGGKGTKITIFPMGAPPRECPACAGRGWKVGPSQPVG